MEPLQSVFDNYLRMQRLLADDNLDGVASLAQRMAKAVRVDHLQMLPPVVAEQAEVLANARTLEAAREAFKPLSTSLISFARAQSVSQYREAYCPMAKASWLQVEPSLANPYMGKEMRECGKFKS